MTYVAKHSLHQDIWRSIQTESMASNFLQTDIFKFTRAGNGNRFFQLFGFEFLFPSNHPIFKFTKNRLLPWKMSLIQVDFFPSSLVSLQLDLLDLELLLFWLLSAVKKINIHLKFHGKFSKFSFKIILTNNNFIDVIDKEIQKLMSVLLHVIIEIHWNYRRKVHIKKII